MKTTWLIGKAAGAFSLLFAAVTLTAQARDANWFFTEESTCILQLEAPFRKLYASDDKNYVPAFCRLEADSQWFGGQIRLRVRGSQRRTVCTTPPLMIDFRQAAGLPRLGKLKLVSGCGNSFGDGQYLLREYLIYKMYNLLTPLSYRVRLLEVSFTDADQPRHSYTQFGFFLEPVDILAARNHSRELSSGMHTEATSRRHSTLVAIFQYLAGNFDWAVPILKNVTLLQPLNNPGAPPLIVPYDFDYAGMVNAPYAVPGEDYGIETVKDRVYRGFPRTAAEIALVIDTLRFYRQSFTQLITDCRPLQGFHRNEMIRYLDEFYELTSDPAKQQEIFIRNARRN
jgi:hypothetical protein